MAFFNVLGISVVLSPFLLTNKKKTREENSCCWTQVFFCSRREEKRREEKRREEKTREEKRREEKRTEQEEVFFSSVLLFRKEGLSFLVLLFSSASFL